MGKNKNSELTVVIPVFNESRNIASCLDALSKQTVPVLAIIVDNNCTDDTMEIARKYTFVKFLNESRQGQQYAQVLGFNYVKTKYIARIDADTILPNDWAETVIQYFNNYPNEIAISGYGSSRSVEVPRVINKIWLWVFYAQARSIYGIDVLWGSNMAMQRSAWQEARKYIYQGKRFVHDDQSLSMALAAAGFEVKLLQVLWVSVESDGLQHLPKFFKYYYSQFFTYYLQRKYKYKKDIFIVRLLLFTITLPFILIWLLVSTTTSILSGLISGIRFLFRSFFGHNIKRAGDNG